MVPSQDAVPTPDEVRRQLDRILSSDLFRGCPRLCPLLRYVVEGSLKKPTPGNDAKLREHQIGFALFDNYSPDKSDVRANASILRGQLRTYYETAGAQDLVKIRIPPPGYRAVFSYNSKSPAAKLCGQAWLKISNFVPSKFGHESLRLLDEAIQADPSYAPALAAKAEAEIREAMYRRTIPPHNPIRAAQKCATDAIALQPKNWRAHVVLGVVHSCHHRWTEAEESFQMALAVAPRSTREHAWYAAYLLAIGKEDEALQLALARATDNQSDVSAQVALGFFLYVTRRVDEAETHLLDVTQDFPNSWLARIALACVYFEKGQTEEALLSYETAYDLLPDDRDFQGKALQGGYCLCALRSEQQETQRASREAVEYACGYDWRAVHRGTEEAIREDYYRELAIASGSLLNFAWEPNYATGDTVLVKNDIGGMPRPGDHDREILYWPPFQIALGCVGLGDEEAAVAALARALDEGDPLTVWLHRWPLFDSLRDNPGFHDLIKRMKLP